ncbi:MAG TPA: hypothetical protein PKB02_03705 [Anaerohalosphaeraceae bacterium]|nr:hypothetical protein [Anaerohalosphaeraceae bacterium]
MENTDFEKQFQGLSIPEKIQILAESEPYRDKFNPLHRQAVSYMLELHCDPASKDQAPLPGTVGELMEHKGFNDPLHPDHKRIMKKFQELHGIK